MKHADFVKTLKSDKGTYEYAQAHDDVQSRVKREFMADLIAKKPLFKAAGIFGPETEDSDAWVRIIKPQEGGTYLKVYGCSYLHRGHGDINTVHGIQLAKSLFSDIPRILSKDWLLAAFVGISWFIRRNHLLKHLNLILRQIDCRVTKHYALPEKEYNEPEREIARVLELAGKGEGVWEEICVHAARFAKIFLLSDNTYRFRVQDALSDSQDIFGFLNTLISREVVNHGIVFKWKFIKLVLRFALFTSPALKRIERKFFKELDHDKVRMDESDWYFSLRFKSYNFGGRSYEEREKEWHKINEEKQHVFLI